MLRSSFVSAVYHLAVGAVVLMLMTAAPEVALNAGQIHTNL
jgi:hypothetical protein